MGVTFFSTFFFLLSFKMNSIKSLFFIYLLYAFSQISTIEGVCGVGQDTKHEGDMVFCTMYDPSDVCCSLESEQELKEEFELQVNTFFGEDCCATNLKRMFCGWNCDPNSSTYVDKTSPDKDGVIDITVNVNKIFADGAYETCKLYEPLGGQAIFTLAADGEQFIEEFFDTANAPGYDPVAVGLRVHYDVNSKAKSHNPDFEEPCCEDLETNPCEKDDGAGSIHPNIFSSLVVFFIS